MKADLTQANGRESASFTDRADIARYAEGVTFNYPRHVLLTGWKVDNLRLRSKALESKLTPSYIAL